MSHSLIRCLFGECDSDAGWESRQRRAVNNDIYDRSSPRCLTEPAFRTYVCGEKNYAMLENMGHTDLVLVDKDPWPWEKKYLLRNKIHCISKALEDFDSVVFVDWDCIAQSHPSDGVLDSMWDDLEDGAPLRSLCHQYVRPLCNWRTEDIRKTPNTGFLYACRGIWKDIEKAWDDNKHLNDEVPVGQVMDELTGGWKGIETWAENFGVKWARMRRRTCEPDWLWKEQQEHAIWTHAFR